MSHPTADDEAPGQAKTGHKNIIKPCALLCGSAIVGGAELGVETTGISSKLILITKFVHTDAWMGIQLQFPIGDPDDNEETGFGVCHFLDGAIDNGISMPSRQHRINIKFPRDGFMRVIRPIDDDATKARFPAFKKNLSLLKIILEDGAQVKVDGFGMPFANPGHPREGWLIRGDPVVDNFTLLDILQQRTFFVVAEGKSDYLNAAWSEDALPPPFSYPYGSDHSWDMDRFQKQLSQNKGPQFAQAWNFDDDNSHVAAMVHSQVQDVFWLEQARGMIHLEKFPVYFVPHQTTESPMFYAIMPLTNEFREKHDAAWRRLTKCESFNLEVRRRLEDEQSEKWEAIIMDHPATIDELKPHFIGAHDFVLLIRWAYGNFQADKKVEMITFDNQSDAPASCAANSDKGMEKFLMSLHRDLMRGTGFYQTLRQRAVDADEHQGLGAAKLPCLPVINLLGTNRAYINALVQEALPDDHSRFRKYFGERPLGLGVITAGPGFGKTTALAVATVGMMTSLGKIFGSAPSNVAVDNFAARVDSIASSVTDRFNHGKKADDTTRARHKLIIRINKPVDEMNAFLRLLQHPHVGDKAAHQKGWKVAPKWKLHLSLSFWLLVMLRSPAVREFRPDESETLQALRKSIDGAPSLARLRAVASGKIDYTEYQQGPMVSRVQLGRIFEALISGADFIASTPSLSEDGKYLSWKNDKAKGIAVDEAANMSRPDLFCVWGNTLRPCVLVGDDKQLAPFVQTLNELDEHGHHRNRLGRDAKLRMATGLFDLCHREVYNDVKFVYGPDCNIALPHHDVGRALEAYAIGKFPGLTPAKEGRLQEIFVHCEGSCTFADEITLSRKCPDQIKIALDFLSDFVTTAGVDPARFVMISPYQANVEIIRRMRKKIPAYSVLATMPAAATVDSFQGREGDSAIIVMGTSSRGSKTGPGFTTDERRLNVLLSCQRSGLLIFGEINVVSVLDAGEGEGKEKGKGKRKGKGTGNTVKFQAENAAGELCWVRGVMLQNVLRTRLLHDFHNHIYIEILGSAFSVMVQASYLIVCDIVVPEKVAVNRFEEVYWPDPNPMCTGGKGMKLAGICRGF
ncbi:putative DNA helicase [Cercophora scortea]|uniref:DNA helicase n=1 Tax=Cercophora scortea TaxID=314031 RepID=A0AAE0MCG9_9PEZI|nr:putative DNA helicase [Cercophora scortea]